MNKPVRIAVTGIWRDLRPGLAPGRDPAQVRERREELSGSRARLGEKPGASTTRTVEIVATVLSVDPKARLITVRGAVQTVTLKVAEDVDLSQIKKGDNVRAVYIETVSIRVRSPGK